MQTDQVISKFAETAAPTQFNLDQLTLPASVSSTLKNWRGLGLTRGFPATARTSPITELDSTLSQIAARLLSVRDLHLDTSALTVGTGIEQLIDGLTGASTIASALKLSDPQIARIAAAYTRAIEWTEATEESPDNVAPNLQHDRLWAYAQMLLDRISPIIITANLDDSLIFVLILTVFLVARDIRDINNRN